MKKVDTEKLLRAYVFVSSVLLIPLVAVTVYLTVAIRALQVSNGYIENDVSHICDEVDTSQYPDYYMCGRPLSSDKN